ncbi:hypothetical protein D3C80_1118750 [compost metagenome]
MAVIFFEFAQQLAPFYRVTGGGEVYRVANAAPDFVKHASTEADGGFRHADKQHRALITGREQRGQLLIDGAHDARLHRNMAAQHLADE